MQTAFERAMNKTAWKQFTSKGKPYYVNSLTKETLVSRRSTRKEEASRHGELADTTVGLTSRARRAEEQD